MWMHLEDVTLSEISQTQKDKYQMIHLYEVPRIVQFIETESRRMVASGWKEEEQGDTA